MKIVPIETIKAGDLISYPMHPKWIALEDPTIVQDEFGQQTLKLAVANVQSLQCYVHMCRLPQMVEIHDD